MRNNDKLEVVFSYILNKQYNSSIIFYQNFMFIVQSHKLERVDEKIKGK